MKKLGMVLAGCVFGASMMAATATTAMAADGPTIQMIVMSINSEYWLNVKLEPRLNWKRLAVS